MKLLTFHILFLFTFQLEVVAQRKSVGYILFEGNQVADSVEMYTLQFPNYLLYNYKNVRSDGRTLIHRFSTLDSMDYKIVDSQYLKHLDLKSPSWLFIEDVDFGYYFDKKGNLQDAPFSRFYVVEKLSLEKFKIISVVPYIGTLN